MYRAGQTKPGARLLAVASLVHGGKPLADIGCDHGKLAVYLAQTGKSPFVVAGDKNPMPLARAKALVQQAGCAGRVECRLGDGLLTVKPGEVEEVVIAGVSGETMVEILSAAPWICQKGMHLVLEPATRAFYLRRWLLKNGFMLDAEIPVAERGRYYSVMSAVYTGIPVACPPALFCEVGLVPDTKSEAAAGYINMCLSGLRNRANAPLPPQEAAELAQLIKEVEKCLP